MVCGCHAVFRIGIRKVFGLPDPLVRESHSKNHDFHCFVAFYDFSSVKNDVNVPSKSNKRYPTDAHKNVTDPGHWSQEKKK
jgi:hypothetical protein